MYKDKTKANEAARERMKRYRAKGVTSAKGVTALAGRKGVTSGQGVTQGVAEGVTYPDILDKLTDPWWRDKLERICAAFKSSHYPPYVQDVWLGDANLSTACDWLTVTD